MFSQEGKDVELAAALLGTVGVAVEHNKSYDSKAEEMKAGFGGHEELLRKVISLCGNPETPKQNYICTKAYSLLGDSFNVIKYARKYLADSGEDLFDGTLVDEDGITVNRGEWKRAGVMMDLASALESTGASENAYRYFSEAYMLQPYNAMAAIKCADVLIKLRGKKEALDFLLEQKNGGYYEPIIYTDALGRRRKNDLFKRLIDAQILKFSAAEGKDIFK